MVYNTLMESELPQQPVEQQPGQSVEPSNWQFKPDDTAAPAPSSPASVSNATPVSWTASEFIAHQKSAGWYILLSLAAVAVAVVIYFLTRDYISSGIILLAAVALGVFAARKPRTLNYQLDNTGIHIGSKSYPYGDFKSFSIIDEGMISSITLTPLKRFMPPLSMYYEHKDEDRITGTLGAYLPFEEGKPDMVDNFMRRIRF